MFAFTDKLDDMPLISFFITAHYVVNNREPELVGAPKRNIV